jgi:hypothetical protein
MLKPPLIMDKTKPTDIGDDSPRGVAPPPTLPFPFPVRGLTPCTGRHKLAFLHWGARDRWSKYMGVASLLPVRNDAVEVRWWGSTSFSRERR